MERMRVTVNQPRIFPSLHIFERILTSNVSINLRSAQLSRSPCWESVYRIKTSQGKLDLSIPVRHYGKPVPIKRAEVVWKDPRWVKKHIKTIEQNYRKAPYFDAVVDGIVRVFMTQWETLAEVALDSMMLGYQWLGEHIVTVHDDELLPNGKYESASAWLLAICKQAKGTEYYCGNYGSSQYLAYQDFEEGGIEVISQYWKCPEYSQLYPPFISNLSIIDLMMNVSPEEGREVLGYAK